MRVMWEGEVREKSYRRAPVYGDSRGTTDKVTHDPGIQGPGIHRGERSSRSGVTEALIKEGMCLYRRHSPAQLQSVGERRCVLGRPAAGTETPLDLVKARRAVFGSWHLGVGPPYSEEASGTSRTTHAKTTRTLSL